ncbi:MAG: hypothetical protein ACLU62_05455 [Hydrogeniiclostridium sp.]
MHTSTENTEYSLWSAQYMEEADILRERVKKLRQEAQQARGSDEADSLNWRAGMLYGMYLDCLHAGRLLKERSNSLGRIKYELENCEKTRRKTAGITGKKHFTNEGAA